MEPEPRHIISIEINATSFYLYEFQIDSFGGLEKADVDSFVGLVSANHLC